MTWSINPHQHLSPPFKRFLALCLNNRSVSGSFTDDLHPFYFCLKRTRSPPLKILLAAYWSFNQQLLCSCHICSTSHPVQFINGIGSCIPRLPCVFFRSLSPCGQHMTSLSNFYPHVWKYFEVASSLDSSAIGLFPNSSVNNCLAFWRTKFAFAFEWGMQNESDIGGCGRGCTLVPVGSRYYDVLAKIPLFPAAPPNAPPRCFRVHSAELKTYPPPSILRIEVVGVKLEWEASLSSNWKLKAALWTWLRHFERRQLGGFSWSKPSLFPHGDE